MKAEKSNSKSIVTFLADIEDSARSFHFCLGTSSIFDKFSFSLYFSGIPPWLCPSYRFLWPAVWILLVPGLQALLLLLLLLLPLPPLLLPLALTPSSSFLLLSLQHSSNTSKVSSRWSSTKAH